MQHYGVFNETTWVAPKLQSEAEVHIFYIHEERLIEPADVIQSAFAVKRRTRTGAETSHLALVELLTLTTVTNPPRNAGKMQAVTSAVEHFRAVGHYHQGRKRTILRKLCGCIQQIRQPGLFREGIRIQHCHQFTVRHSGETQVSGSGKTNIATGAYNFDTAVIPQIVEIVPRFMVVHHNHPIRQAYLVPQANQTLPEHLIALIIYDDYGNRHILL